MKDFDFGFTASTVEDVVKSAETTDRAKAMYDAIMPLLKNLQKDADTHPIINWPNRSKTIGEFIVKLNSILTT